MKSRIDLAVAAGRAAWPALALDEATFRAHLESLAAAEDDPLRFVEDVHAGDVLLACACANGVSGAVAAFENTYGAEMSRAALRLRATRPVADEILQRVRVKLFVAEQGAAPKIASYSGRGPLLGWLRVLIVREHVAYHRANPSDPRDEADVLLDEVTIADGDPESAVLRARFGPVFKAAFQDAMASLEPRERTVLRLHLIDKVSVDQIAASYGVHRVSASRWLSQARDALLERTTRALRDRLGVSQPELESIIRACMSHLEVSLDRVLQRA